MQSEEYHVVVGYLKDKQVDRFYQPLRSAILSNIRQSHPINPLSPKFINQSTTLKIAKNTYIKENTKLNFTQDLQKAKQLSKKKYRVISMRQKPLDKSLKAQGMKKIQNKVEIKVLKYSSNEVISITPTQKNSVIITEGKDKPKNLILKSPGNKINKYLEKVSLKNSMPYQQLIINPSTTKHQNEKQNYQRSNEQKFGSYINKYISGIRKVSLNDSLGSYGSCTPATNFQTQHNFFKNNKFDRAQKISFKEFEKQSNVKGSIFENSQEIRTLNISQTSKASSQASKLFRNLQKNQNTVFNENIQKSFQYTPRTYPQNSYKMEKVSLNKYIKIDPIKQAIKENKQTQKNISLHLNSLHNQQNKHNKQNQFNNYEVNNKCNKSEYSYNIFSSIDQPFNNIMKEGYYNTKWSCPMNQFFASIPEKKKTWNIQKKKYENVQK